MRQLSLAIIVLQLLCIAKSVPINNEKKTTKTCGYDSCPRTKKGYVNVHLIPHSHDDVGWVKTVDQFYYGTNSIVYSAGVQFIYDSVLKSVEKNSERRFIYVETAFFWKWWQEQGERERNLLKKLVNNGQIEFIGGGWSMNDEAVTNYQSVIDQMTWGLRKLDDCFGECGRPKMGWQIDPFGHSSEMASIFSQLGYDGVILGRIDFEDKNTRLLNKSMEMVWRGSNNLGRSTDIFTSVLYNHYDAPSGFCFDILCNDEPLVDDVDSPEYNIAQRAQTFLDLYVRPLLISYQTSNVIIPMGRDFAYQEAEIWFRNIDRLIKYINNKEEFSSIKYNLMYSTPSCYAAAVHKETAGILTSPLKTDDFFPYASEARSYWTGFYTSRPTLKRFERMGNNFLQVCKQLHAIADISSEHEYKLNSLREAMGVMQHHDAITGTEKEVVAYDYARLLNKGIKNCEDVASRALKKLTNIHSSIFNTCWLANVSECAPSENAGTFVVTVYNPLSRPVRKVVRLPVSEKLYIVTGPDGDTVKSDLIPISQGVQKIIGGNDDATLELVFIADDVPPLGYKSFYVKSGFGEDIVQEDLSVYFSYSTDNGVSFSIDESTGLVNSITMNGISLQLNQTFWYYNGTNAWNFFNYRASGAYIFRPEILHPIKIVSDRAPFEVYRGDIVTEVHQRFNEFVSQTVRVYNSEDYIEFDWIVGPLEQQDDYSIYHGKEVITRYSTQLHSKGVFYTDSNGRELVKRIRNFRPTWNINMTEKEASNYYPVTSKITLRDEDANIGFSVLTDRAQGGSSLKNGDIELMLLRNSVADDRLGVDEALMEFAFGNPIMVRGSHYVVAGHIKNTSESDPTIASLEHKIADQKLLDSWIFISVPKEESFEDYKNIHVMEFSGLKRFLPENVHIMTLEPWKGSSYLLRLEHTFEKDEDPVLSKPVSINLEDIFTTFEITSIQETTLGANQLLVKNRKLNFKSLYQADEFQEEMFIKNHQKNRFIVTLNPMQIRTFVIGIKARNQQ